MTEDPNSTQPFEEPESPNTSTSGSLHRRRTATTAKIGNTKYERYNGKNGTIYRIYFAFELPPGETQLDAAIYNVLKQHQRWPKNGARTGLRHERGWSEGSQVWSLPSTMLGMTLADTLDNHLLELAHELRGGHRLGR